MRAEYMHSGQEYATYIFLTSNALRTLI